MSGGNKFRRMRKVLSMCFVIFLQIYWYKLRNKREEEWEKLWGNIGRKFRTTLFELEGLLIKVGQLFSIRADLLPDAFVRELQDLTDQVPPSSWEEIKGILETEWGDALEVSFRSIQRDAVASASIGEVYKGALKDGTEVAIKVQRPQIQSIIQTDFRTLSIIIWFANHLLPVPKGFINFNVLFKELKLVIERELDYREEREALLKFKERYQGMKSVKIPDVFDELCTSKVLVMEWVDGIRISDVNAVELEEVGRQELAQRLIQVFLPQWLEPGLFHADPHPGNVLVSKKGEIILLDFGMVGEITEQDATIFQRLIESFLAKNYVQAVDCLAQLDFLLPGADTKTMERLLAEFMSFRPEQLKEMDLLALKVEMNDLVQALPIQVPTRFVFLGRSFVSIEGILRQLTPEADLLDLGKPVFKEWIRNQGSNKWIFIWKWIQSQPVFKVFHSINEFLNLPQTIERVAETEQRREFQFTILENQKKQFFQLTLVGLIGIGAAITFSHDLLLKGSAGFVVVAGIGYFLIGYKQKKWLKYMHEKRK